MNDMVQIDTNSANSTLSFAKLVRFCVSGSSIGNGTSQLASRQMDHFLGIPLSAMPSLGGSKSVNPNTSYLIHDIFIFYMNYIYDVYKYPQKNHTSILKYMNYFTIH